MSSEKCELCGSEWGDHWETVNSENLKFCCEICAIEYKNLIDSIDEDVKDNFDKIISITGNKYERICNVKLKENGVAQYRFNFNSIGELRTFDKI